MTDVIVPERSPNRRAAEYGLDILPATWSEGVSATFDETWVRNYSPSIARHIERQQYESDPYPWPGEVQTPPEFTILSADDANAEYGIEGHLSFDSDTPEPIAKNLNELKQAEIQSRDTVARSKIGGFTRFTTALVASILDPINVATAFIPVIGEANFARISGQVGVNTARVIKGAAEGAVGAALVEPAVLYVARQEQADYTATDSLMNLALGTVMGGGLHLGAGFIGDRLAGRAAASPVAQVIDQLPTQDRADLLRAAVAQVAEGKAVDVSPVFETAVDRHGFDQPYELKTKEFSDKAKELGLTDVQRDALMPKDVRDPVTGFYNKEERIPTLERAMEHVKKTDQPSFYVEADIGNLNGLNARFGHSGADAIYKDLSDLFKQAVEESGGEAILFRHGGDEISAIVVNGDEQTLSSALVQMQTRVKEYVNQKGLREVPHTKTGRQPGTGLSYGVSPIEKGDSVNDIMSRADKQVELNKLGGNDVNGESVATVGADTFTRQSGSIASGTRKADRIGQSAAQAQSRIERATKHAESEVDEKAAKDSVAFDEELKNTTEPSDVQMELALAETEVAELKAMLPADLVKSAEVDAVKAEAVIYAKAAKAAAACRMGKY